MRNKITNDFAIRLILKKIAESVTKPLSFSRLTNILKSAGTSIGKQTVINYVRYMTDSYLLFTLQNYAAKLVEKETSPKYYFMDTGLLGLVLLDCKSAQLENLVAIELIRRYGTGRKISQHGRTGRIKRKASDRADSFLCSFVQETSPCQ